MHHPQAPITERSPEIDRRSSSVLLGSPKNQFSAVHLPQSFGERKGECLSVSDELWNKFNELQVSRFLSGTYCSIALWTLDVG